MLIPPKKKCLIWCIKCARRIMTSPSFTDEFILGAILFEQTMDRKVEGQFTADYLWQTRGIVPFLKVDQGLAPLEGGVQLMKTDRGLDALLKRAVNRNVFGTKMRSVISQAVPEGISRVVDQQFEYALQILKADLVPIIEPEVDIHSADKAQSEVLLKQELLRHLDTLPDGSNVMLKLSIPTVDGFYSDLMRHPRVCALSRSPADTVNRGKRETRAQSRTDREFFPCACRGTFRRANRRAFNETLAASIQKIYAASIL
jgi:fructose-bisphosphate aldolase class I